MGSTLDPQKLNFYREIVNKLAKNAAASLADPDLACNFIIIFNIPALFLLPFNKHVQLIATNYILRQISLTLIPNHYPNAPIIGYSIIGNIGLTILLNHYPIALVAKYFIIRNLAKTSLTDDPIIVIVNFIIVNERFSTFHHKNAFAP
jgi:hypothetical protein